MNEQELLLDCLQRLNAKRIPYMITGSMASNAWGIPRTTHDLDFLIQLSRDKVSEFANAFSDGGYAVDAEMVQSAFAPPHMFNVIHPPSGLKLDFWMYRPDDEYEREMFSRRVQENWLGEPASMATAEDVILHKLLWHQQSPSDRQLGDVAGVVAVQGEALDRAYLSRWADKLQLTEILHDALTGKIKPKQT